jgi:hypothetical protein
MSRRPHLIGAGEHSGARLLLAARVTKAKLAPFGRHSKLLLLVPGVPDNGGEGAAIAPVYESLVQFTDRFAAAVSCWHGSFIPCVTPRVRTPPPGDAAPGAAAAGGGESGGGAASPRGAGEAHSPRGAASSAPRRRGGGRSPPALSASSTTSFQFTKNIERPSRIQQAAYQLLDQPEQRQALQLSVNQSIMLIPDEHRVNEAAIEEYARQRGAAQFLRWVALLRETAALSSALFSLQQ